MSDNMYVHLRRWGVGGGIDDEVGGVEETTGLRADAVKGGRRFCSGGGGVVGRGKSKSKTVPAAGEGWAARLLL